MPPTPHREPDTILYGCAYYHEYMPVERLAADVALMKEIGFTVMRLGESTWSLWEPEDGVFEFAWIDRVVDALHAAGIRVILGTPTYALPPWLAAKHPEILAVRPEDGRPTPFGLRQQINVAHPAFRWHAERIVRIVVERFARHPAVIGWQVDNEAQNGGSSNPDVERAFLQRLKRKFGTAEALNRAWGLAYWGQTLGGWEDLWSRRGTISPSHKLEWTRHQQSMVEEFLRWQAEWVHALKHPDQFVTHDFCGANWTNCRANVVSRHLDIAAVNPYHGTQEDFDGHAQTLHGDMTRSYKHRTFLATETNGQAIGWDSRGQFPPYDGQLRLNVYCLVAAGADLVEYWHWHSAHAGQEIFWKGILGHDLEPNRVSREAARVAAELKRVGPRLAGATHASPIAILHSVDSLHGLGTMPFQATAPMELETTVHRACHTLNASTDFTFPEDEDLSRWKVIVAPCLYVADDALLARYEAFVREGGHLVLGPKSAFCTEHNTVRPMRAPGPLRSVAGASYQEFSSLKGSFPLKDLAFAHEGTNEVRDWCEFLEPEGADVLARIDHPFFGRWAAITRHRVGRGSVTLVGTVPHPDLWVSLLRYLCTEAGVPLPYADVPRRVVVREATGRTGKHLTYLLNCSGTPQSPAYRGPAGTELLGGQAIASGQTIALAPWDAAVIEA